MYPTITETYRLITEYRMPLHILAHSLMVRRVALIIGSSLKDAGLAMDLRLVESGSLLHDICKMECIGNGHDHALMGSDVLSSLGYAAAAQVVGQHVRLRTLSLNEAMVVNYADKRVMHTRVVPLVRRFVDLMDRYGTDDARRERILMHHQECVRVEEIINSSCSVDLDGLDNLNLIPLDKPLYEG